MRRSQRTVILADTTDKMSLEIIGPNSPHFMQLVLLFEPDPAKSIPVRESTETSMQ
jgi:hypothetical protein